VSRCSPPLRQVRLVVAALVLTEHHHDSIQLALPTMPSRGLGHSEEMIDSPWSTRRALDLYRILDQPVWEAEALNAVAGTPLARASAAPPATIARPTSPCTVAVRTPTERPTPSTA